MSKHRIGIGKIRHESNTFFRESTTLADFESFAGGIVVGDELLSRPGRRDEVTGFLEVFGDAPVELVPLLTTTTPPSGPIADDAADAIESTLREQLRRARPLDGICFSLHGAMSGVSTVDLDGHFLRVIREEVGPRIPIVCPLDCHAVISHEMVELTTAMTAYRTHPHTDVVETGERAARILLDALGGKTRPVLRHRTVPMLFPDGGTETPALRRLFDKFIAWDETDGVIAYSLCPSYPYQDVPHQGWTVLAVTGDDAELAERLARELAADVWEAGESLLPEPMLAPEEAIRTAADMPGCPVIVTDAADNVGAGAPGDTTRILEAVIETRREVDGLILLHIPDAEAVSAAKAAGVGKTVSLDVGGKRDTRFGRPVRVTGQILCVTEGSITDDGKFGDEPTIDVGDIVSLALDNVRLVLTERVIKGPQPSLFRKVGIEPFDAKVVAVKSGIGYKVTYGPVAKAVLDADCPGPGSRNVANLGFRNVPRPIFPLDADMQWQME